MNTELKKTYVISAPASKVWKALTNTEMIRQYFFGTEARSDWKEGSTITYSGTWEDKPYEDKGIILKLIPEKLMTINYWSNRSGKPDLPENYSPYTYELSDQNGETALTLTQEGNFQSEEAKGKAWEHWDIVMAGLKKLVES
ncbi:MAG TPA: SRPBCC family protein [Sphingobacteriaceae bacterium]